MGTRREEMTAVVNSIAEKGFSKTFFENDFEEVENPTFHKLRNSYLKARLRLTKYITNHSPVETK